MPGYVPLSRACHGVAQRSRAKPRGRDGQRPGRGALKRLPRPRPPLSPTPCCPALSLSRVHRPGGGWPETGRGAPTPCPPGTYALPSRFSRLPAPFLRPPKPASPPPLSASESRLCARGAVRVAAPRPPPPRCLPGPPIAAPVALTRYLARLMVLPPFLSRASCASRFSAFFSSSRASRSLPSALTEAARARYHRADRSCCTSSIPRVKSSTASPAPASPPPAAPH